MHGIHPSGVDSDRVEIRDLVNGQTISGHQPQCRFQHISSSDKDGFRLLEAKRLLLHSELTIAEIGYEIGFGDVVAFLASDGARWITGASIPADGGSKL